YRQALRINPAYVEAHNNLGNAMTKRGELGEAIVDQVQRAGDRQMFLELARAALDMVEEKHLLIQIEDPVVAGAMAELGWDGALTPGAGDFLMLVDSNVGFNKVDPKVGRSLAYAVDLSDPRTPRASVRIRYLHSVVEEAPCVHVASYGEGTYADLQARCYWDYVRVLTPNGSQLIEGSLPPTPGVWLLSGSAEPGLWDVAEAEGGTTVFGGIFVLPTGAQAELDLAYTLPASVVSKEPDGSLDYALRLTKQPGSEGIAVTVQIIPPESFTARNPQGWEVLVEGSLLWEGRLTKDVELDLRFVRDSS
ncbi:MAG: type IV pilus biogenesis/stability protein PilW, partial [Anaerolineales bacterium]